MQRKEKYTLTQREFTINC